MGRIHLSDRVSNRCTLLTLGQTVGLYVTGAVVVWVLGVAGLPYLFDKGARSKDICLPILKQIDSAKEQYRIDHNLHKGDPVPAGVLSGPGGYIRCEPKCPNGGVYTIGVVGKNPRCSLGDEDSPPWGVEPSEHRLE